MKNLVQKAQNLHTLAKDELLELLSTSDYDVEIFSAANQVRKKYVGDEIYLRALIEFSNICKNSCKYCGLRRENAALERYSLSKSEILHSAKNAINAGFKTIVLQSGESQSVSTDEVCKVVEELKKFDVAVTLSLGEKTQEEYKSLKAAGADRYLLRIETTDKLLYEKMHPNMSFENRINCLESLKALGYELATGCLVGLPEQTLSSLANDILFFKEIGADMVGIGPLIVHPQTPLKGCPDGSFTTALKVMALTRLLLPSINIPATTAMETITPEGRIVALQSGANVVMPNATQTNYSQKYEIYPNKNCKTSLENHLCELNCKFASIGRTIKMSRGNSLKWEQSSKRKA